MTIWDHDIAVLAVALFGAFCLGVSKTGFPGLALVNVLIMVELFGGLEAVGIILPLLIVCDLVVYPMFRRYASWRQVWPLLVPTLGGIGLGYLLLRQIDSETAKRVIAAIILFMLGMQLLRQYRGRFLEHLPDSRFFLVVSGLTIGVSTTLANAAGPVYSIYALVHRMTKEDFLGVGARFFLLVNLIKAPFLTERGLIDGETLLLDAMMLPGIFAGILAGRKLIAMVPQQVFEILLYAFSLAAGLKLLFW